MKMKRGKRVRVDEHWVKELAEIIRVDEEVVQNCVDMIAQQHKTNRANVIQILQTHFRPDLMSALPVELRFMILQGLSVKDIVSFCASSKDNIYLCDDPKLWSSLLSRDFGRYDFKHLQDMDPRAAYSILDTNEDVYRKIFDKFSSLNDEWDKIKKMTCPKTVELFASTFLSLIESGQIFWTLMEETGFVGLASQPGSEIGLAVLFAKICVELANKNGLGAATKFAELMPSSVDFQLVLSFVPVILAKQKADDKIQPRLFDKMFDWYLTKAEERGLATYLENARSAILPGDNLPSDRQMRIFSELAKKIKMELVLRIVQS